MADVFISYATEDREFAALLAAAFESESLSVWWDRKLVPGAIFDQVIEREIRAAKAVVTVWSHRAVASEWVKSEAALAAEHDSLIPVRLDDCDLPLEFRRRQTAALIGWSGHQDDPNFLQVVSAVRSKGAIPRGARQRKTLQVARSTALRNSIVAGAVLCLSWFLYCVWPQQENAGETRLSIFYVTVAGVDGPHHVNVRLSDKFCGTSNALPGLITRTATDKAAIVPYVVSGGHLLAKPDSPCVLSKGDYLVGTSLDDPAEVVRKLQGHGLAISELETKISTDQVKPNVSSEGTVKNLAQIPVHVVAPAPSTYVSDTSPSGGRSSDELPLEEHSMGVKDVHYAQLNFYVEPGLPVEVSANATYLQSAYEEQRTNSSQFLLVDGKPILEYDSSFGPIRPFGNLNAMHAIISEPGLHQAIVRCSSAFADYISKCELSAFGIRETENTNISISDVNVEDSSEVKIVGYAIVSKYATGSTTSVRLVFARDTVAAASGNRSRVSTSFLVDSPGRHRVIAICTNTLTYPDECTIKEFDRIDSAKAP